MDIRFAEHLFVWPLHQSDQHRDTEKAPLQKRDILSHALQLDHQLFLRVHLLLCLGDALRPVLLSTKHLVLMLLRKIHVLLRMWRVRHVQRVQ